MYYIYPVLYTQKNTFYEMFFFCIFIFVRYFLHVQVVTICLVNEYKSMFPFFCNLSKCICCFAGDPTHNLFYTKFQLFGAQVLVDHGVELSSISTRNPFLLLFGVNLNLTTCPLIPVLQQVVRSNFWDDLIRLILNKQMLSWEDSYPSG